jgi:hypothetical protein
VGEGKNIMVIMVTKNLSVTMWLGDQKLWSPCGGGDWKPFGWHMWVATEFFSVAIVAWPLNLIAIRWH